MTITTALRDLNNAVLDLQSADYNTFERPLERLSSAINAPDVQQFTNDLRSKADFDKFLEGASNNGGMMGSARLNWPASRVEELGLVIQLIERAAKQPQWFLNLAHTYYYSGRKFVGDIRKITTAVIIPFNRDFANYIQDLTDTPPAPNATTSQVTYNIGTMNNSPLQHVESGSHGEQTTTYATDNLQAVIDLYKQRADELALEPALRRRADAQIATLEAQLLDEPDPAIVNAAGKSLKTIVEGALGGAAGNVLASPGTWGPLIAMFS